MDVFKSMSLNEKINDRLRVLAWTVDNFGFDGYYDIYIKEINHYYDILDKQG